MHIQPYAGLMAKQNTERHTPLRPLRIPDDEWVPLGEAVGARNRTRLIRDFIAWYLCRPGAELPSRPGENTPAARPDAGSGR